MFPENPARPILCLVTDRRRLCPDADDTTACRCVIAQVREAVSAGVPLVQIREPDLATRPLTTLVAEAVATTGGTRTRILVNDRLDVALAIGAAGVHLRADSIPPSEARRLAPAGFLVGRSVHDLGEAAAVERDVDYLIAGTVFLTDSKPGQRSLLGEAGLASIVRAVRVPVLAIGGVTLGTVARVGATGAAGAAAIGLFIGPDRGAGRCRAVPLGAIAGEVRARFDSLKTAP